MKKQLVILTFLAVVTAGCGGWAAANTPGVTRDPEKAAEKAFPDVPEGQESADLRIEGEKLFNRFACAGCHSTSDQRNGLQGPPLAGVADRYLPEHENDPLETRRWLVKHIKNPIDYPGLAKEDPEYKGLVMTPNPRISDEDMRALVEFLWHLG